MINKTKGLKTMEKIKLRKFTSNDFQDYFSLVSNKKVMAMITEYAILH